MDRPELLISQLFVVIKRKLKAKGLTYRDVTYALDATEVSVKRWFSEERLTILQLTILSNLLGLTLTELMKEAEEPPLQQLTLVQETELANDAGLRLVARCAINNMTLAEIVEEFRFTEAECVQHLIRLDQLRMIDLLPGNQIRIRISRDFDFLPDGPLIELARKRSVVDGFLEKDAPGYIPMIVLRANLSNAAIKQFQVYLRRLKRQLAELHADSFDTPMEERHSFFSIVLQREWDPDYIRVRRRVKKDKAPPENLEADEL